MARKKLKPETAKRKLDRLDSLNEQLRQLLSDERKLQARNAEQIIRNDVEYSEAQRVLRAKELKEQSDLERKKKEDLQFEQLAKKCVQLPVEPAPVFIPCHTIATKGLWNHLQRWMEGRP